MKHPYSYYVLAIALAGVSAWCAAWWALPAAVLAAAASPTILAALVMTMATAAIPLAVRDAGIDDAFDSALVKVPAVTPAANTTPTIGEAYTQVFAETAETLDLDDDWELIAQFAEAPTVTSVIREEVTLDWSDLSDDFLPTEETREWETGEALAAATDLAEYYRLRLIKADQKVARLEAELRLYQSDSGKARAADYLKRAAEVSENSPAMTAQEEYEEAARRG